MLPFSDVILYYMYIFFDFEFSEMKEETRFRYVEYFYRSPINKKFRKNWIHENATEKVCFNRFSITVTIFGEISSVFS